MFRAAGFGRRPGVEGTVGAPEQGSDLRLRGVEEDRRLAVAARPGRSSLRHRCRRRSSRRARSPGRAGASTCCRRAATICRRSTASRAGRSGRWPRAGCPAASHARSQMYWTFGSGREAGCLGSVRLTTWPLGPGAGVRDAVGRDDQREHLRVAGIVNDVPGGAGLGLAAEDLAASRRWPPAGCPRASAPGPRRARRRALPAERAHGRAGPGRCRRSRPRRGAPWRRRRALPDARFRPWRGPVPASSQRSRRARSRRPRRAETGTDVVRRPGMAHFVPRCH